MNLLQRVATAANRGFAHVLTAPVLGPVLGRSMVEMAYVGRNSGRPIKLIVAYRRVSPNELVVRVGGAKYKTWWRNCYPDGGPITVHLDGAQRTGFAVARTTDKGTSVKIVLEDVAP